MNHDGAPYALSLYETLDSLASHLPVASRELFAQTLVSLSAPTEAQMRILNRWLTYNGYTSTEKE
jgi:hypothetical protein